MKTKNIGRFLLRACAALILIVFFFIPLALTRLTHSPLHLSWGEAGVSMGVSFVVAVVLVAVASGGAAKTDGQTDKG